MNFNLLVVCEDLSRFNQPGGNIFSKFFSKATSWRGTGVFRKSIEELGELLGIPTRVVNPAYTRKIAYYTSQTADPRAEAGYLIRKQGDMIYMEFHICFPHFYVSSEIFV